MSNTNKLAEFICKQKQISQEALNAAHRLIMDSIGCALGAINTSPGKVVKNYVKMQGSGNEKVLGLGNAASPVTAAYANGRLINILDQDETYLVLGHHANAALGAALALADYCKLDGKKLLRAFTIGYEVGARVGNYMGVQLKVNEEGKVNGWNFPGPILGAFAACASASVCLDLNVNQVENALGICAMYLPSNSGGLWEEGRKHSTLPTVKYEDCGFNTQAGVMAALMASEGITGTLGIFDSDSSLSQVASAGSKPNYETLVAGLGEDWRITRTSIKLWPSCRWYHYALTALDFAIKDKSINPDTIESIEVWSAPACVLNVSPEIGENIVMDASFSVSHAIAMMLLKIPAGPAWFDQSVVYNEKADQLRKKVKIYLNPELSIAQNWGDYKNWGQKDAVLKVPSRVVVTCSDAVYEGKTDYAYGDTWNDEVELTDSAVRQKFETIAIYAKPDSKSWKIQVSKLADRLANLEQEKSISELLKEFDVEKY